MIDLTKPCIPVEDLVCLKYVPYMPQVYAADGETDLSRVKLVGMVFGANKISAGEMIWFAKNHGYFDGNSENLCGTRKMLERAYSLHSGDCRLACSKCGIDTSLLSLMCSVCARANYVNNALEMAERVIVNAVYHKANFPDVEKAMTPKFQKRMKARRVFFENDADYGTRLIAVPFESIYQKMLTLLLRSDVSESLEFNSDKDAARITRLVLSENTVFNKRISSSSKKHIQKEIYRLVSETFTITVTMSDIDSAIGSISSFSKGSFYSKQNFSKRFSVPETAGITACENTSHEKIPQEDEQLTLFDDPLMLLDASSGLEKCIEPSVNEESLNCENTDAPVDNNKASKSDPTTAKETCEAENQQKDSAPATSPVSAEMLPLESEDNRAGSLKYTDNRIPILTADISLERIRRLRKTELRDFVKSLWRLFSVSLEAVVLNGMNGLLIHSAADPDILFFLSEEDADTESLELLFSKSNVSFVTVQGMVLHMWARMRSAVIKRNICSMNSQLAVLTYGRAASPYEEIEKLTGIKAPGSSPEFLMYIKEYTRIKGTLDRLLLGHPRFDDLEIYRFYEVLCASAADASLVLDISPGRLYESVRSGNAYCKPGFRYTGGEDIRCYGTIHKIEYRLCENATVSGVVFATALMQNFLIRRPEFSKYAGGETGTRPLWIHGKRFCLLSISDDSLYFYSANTKHSWSRFVKEYIVILAAKTCRQLGIDHCSVECSVIKRKTGNRN